MRNDQGTVRGSLFVGWLPTAMLVLVCALGSGRSVAADALTGLKIIHAGQALLVPGEAPRRTVTIVVRGGSIERVSDGFLDAGALGVGADTDIIDLRQAFILPGLMDVHVHLRSQPRPTTQSFDAARLLSRLQTPEEMTLTAYANAADFLRAGYTTVRDVDGDPAAIFALRDAVSNGTVLGPRIYAAGFSLSPTGGHSDPPATARLSQTLPPGVCDGADSCRQLTRFLIRNGANLIKLHATGGGSEESGSAEFAPSFTKEEFAAIVETAHGLGRRVAAHAHGARGINAALAAGVDSIEHGDGLTDESIRLFLKNGAFLVPTLSMVDDLQRRVNEMARFGETVFKSRYEAVIRSMPLDIGRAYRAGVKIAAGSDRLVGENRELEWYVKIGMTPNEALGTATRNAAELIGISQRAGSLEAGKWADIIAVNGDPTRAIEDVRKVVFVMKGGRVVQPAAGF